MAAENELERSNGRSVMDFGSNVILIGAMGSGKSTVGWLAARLMGFGFLDLDEYIERRERRTIDEIFQQDGELRFRALEKEALEELSGLKSHLVSVGGGTTIDDENWARLKEMGTTVWLDTPPDEIARRLLLGPAELAKRPLLKELVDEPDRNLKHRLLTERLSALIGQRGGRYREADLAVSDSYSTPESTAARLRDALVGGGYISPVPAGRPVDRWGAF